MIIIDGYNAKIEKCYGLADCYVFPTTTSVGSIDVPLTVLEAMAHNLPVVSTKFGGLPRIFKEGSGFFYADVASFCTKIQALKQGLVDVHTRELVLPYSWDNIANNLYAVYQELLDA